jgi:hypothetical protein
MTEACAEPAIGWADASGSAIAVLTPASRITAVAAAANLEVRFCIFVTPV